MKRKAKKTTDTTITYAEFERLLGVIVEGVRDEIRIFAESIQGHSERLDKHEERITLAEEAIFDIRGDIAIVKTDIDDIK